jgi:YceI-like protein
MKFLPIFLFTIVFTAEAQKFTAEKSSISFFSDAALEDIKAENNLVGSLFNSTSGELVYIVKIKDFKFEKSLMREHFNEKYMETEKFPKSTFQGKITGFKANTPGQQKVRAIGKLSIHGITRDIDVPGTLEFASGKVNMQSKFIVKLVDYNIKIPKLVWQNIAEEIEVKIDFTYKPI